MGRPIMIILEIVFGMALLALLFIIFKPGIIDLGNGTVHTAKCIMVRASGDSYGDRRFPSDCAGTDNGSNNHNGNNGNHNGNNNNNSSNNHNGGNGNNGNHNNGGGSNNNGNHDNGGGNNSNNNNNNNNNNKHKTTKGNIFIHYIYQGKDIQDTEAYGDIGTLLDMSKYESNNNLPNGYTIDKVSNKNIKFSDTPQNVSIYLKKTPKVNVKLVANNLKMITGFYGVNSGTLRNERNQIIDLTYGKYDLFDLNAPFSYEKKPANIINGMRNSGHTKTITTHVSISLNDAKTISKFVPGEEGITDNDDTNHDADSHYHSPITSMNTYQQLYNNSKDYWDYEKAHSKDYNNDPRLFNYDVVSDNLKQDGNTVVGTVTQTFVGLGEHTVIPSDPF